MKGATMIRKLISGLTLAALAATASAQVDWPTFKGQNTRTGVTSSVLGVDPGQATLRWYFPLQSSMGRTMIADNTGVSGTTGTWTTPLPADESPDFYAPTGVALTSPYIYSQVVASTAG